ncbi:hypothetical protein LGK95_10250 [Clostridium algoriphilum]|uniref:DUF7852 domain-containing protein n=1 Tax=Clostridium algoriphilum TaxID=198347 RepID=UPI001CF5A05B|nr:hypothetical protein [Clostridium algoriphilum]MCB2293902.1 hypothetical protein [Clostridium algoriphilum]
MKTDNNREKLRLIKSLIILNMLQQPSCFINIHKTSKKSSTKIKRKNRNPNNLNIKKNSKDKLNKEFIPPIQQVTFENDSESILPVCDKLSIAKFLVTLKLLQQSCYNENINKTLKNTSININHENKVTPNKLNLIRNSKDKLNTKYILPTQQVTFENDSESILPFCDKLSMESIHVILKLLQQSCYNENINKTFKNTSISINHENKVTPNKLSLIRNSKDKLNTKYILPIQEVIIEDDTDCIKKKGEINTTTNDIYKIPKNINTDHFGNLISTLPIIIAEKDIDIPIESTFRLKNAALDIKNMKKDIYLTNSKLIPLHEKEDISASLNGKLFLEGFVRNKLDFSVIKGVNDSIINLDTECVIIYIPFKCTTLINYKVPPVFSKVKDYIPIYISSNCLNVNKDFNEYLSEKNTQRSEYMNCDIRPLNCEIEQATIYETYSLIDKKPFSENFPLEMNFHTIKESILINLSLTLIQKQDIAINHK